MKERTIVTIFLSARKLSFVELVYLEWCLSVYVHMHACIYTWWKNYKMNSL